MNGAIQQALAELPPLIAAHLRLSGSAIAIGTAAGLPMAIWAARSRRAGGPLLEIGRAHV